VRRLREQMALRLTPGERQDIELAAFICGVPPSRFIRESASLLAKQAILEHQKETNARYSNQATSNSAASALGG
jgi:uncharacterized protein (DUF1778 family)